MKYFVTFLSLTILAVTIPQAFGDCTSFPCDDAKIILKEPDYQFIDFSYSNKIGEPIQFIIEKTRDDNCNSYNAKITDDNGNFILGWGAEISCAPASISSSESVLTKIGYNENKPIIINESGKYYLEVEFRDVFIKREFVVRETISGISLDRTVYPVSDQFQSPLKQIKSGVATDKIRCNEGLKLIYKNNEMPACVKSTSILKLAERGWISETDEHSLLALKKVSESCTNDSPKERMTNPLRYSNGTHVFLNLGCEWKKIGVYVGDATSSYMNKIIPTLEDFKKFSSESTDIDTIFFRFGEPVKDIGSEIYIYVYELNDSTEVWVGYAEKILYIRHIDQNGSFLDTLFELENQTQILSDKDFDNLLEVKLFLEKYPHSEIISDQVASGHHYKRYMHTDEATGGFLYLILVKNLQTGELDNALSCPPNQHSSGYWVGNDTVVEYLQNYDCFSEIEGMEIDFNRNFSVNTAE